MAIKRVNKTLCVILSLLIGVVIVSYYFVISCEMKLNDLSRQTVILNNENEELERASFRGKVNNVNYIDCLNASELLYGEGHGSAFGVLSINPTKRVFKLVEYVMNWRRM